MKSHAAIAMVAVVALAAACANDSPAPPAPSTADGGGPTSGAGGATLEQRVEATLVDLASFGEKIAGTPGGMQAGDYIKERFEALGIEDVTFESFSFSSFVMTSSSLDVLVDGGPLAMSHEVFHYSGAGQITAELVDVGVGRVEDYAGVDVTGKIVLLERDPIFHRQSQLKLVIENGGAAMLYISTSPDNLVQIGTVADPEDGLAQIPALTVGADDGEAIRNALDSGSAVSAAIGVSATLSPATGRNVVARVPGSDDSGAYILVGAHYDTWHIGSTDNGTGVAALLAMARAVTEGGPRRLGVVFVGYDGEELGLFGGYDFLRRHTIVGQEPMLAFVNLEMPAAGPPGSGLRAVAHTNDGPIDPKIRETELADLYSTYVGMEVVPAQFGGLIPTDIQGMYWNGKQGFTTFCESAYYHTTEDTPDKVDIPFLARAVTELVGVLDALDDEPLQSFYAHDGNVWFPDVVTTAEANGDLTVDVVAKDASGVVQPAANVTAWVDVDDFSRVHIETAVADNMGAATLVVPAAALAQGAGSRWLHVTVGASHTMHEHIQPLP